MFEIVLKGGRVLDPATGKDGIYDVAISDGKIAGIAPDLSGDKAQATYLMSDKIIIPGLIDAHCHPAGDFSEHGIDPDEAGVNAGVLLVNDGGTAGSANFSVLRNMVENSRTEILYFINFASCGLIQMPEIASENDFNIDKLKQVVAKEHDSIIGVKLRIVESLCALDSDVPALAKKTATELGLPLMIHLGEVQGRQKNDSFNDYSRRAVSLLEKGDILSHFMTGCPGGMVQEGERIYPELAEARDRGVFLDCCHGKNNLSFKVASTLIQNGYFPDIISTDLTMVGKSYVQSLLVTMSKFLSFGMPLKQVIAAATSNAARALGVESRWGSLDEGRFADITVLSEVSGDFDFSDGAAGNRMNGRVLLEPYMGFSKGVPFSCRSFYHLPPECITG